ncbi:uncharacterized protein LOC117306650 [Asterias rubens]|uniref:uncharacterized protein LOC117306650 n=1 Tax=Asterias rubens TaxID=7604 RepID=UPI0014553D12|nr:uncharacterized protein LOC117306650 [Asterias rubens]
MAQEKCKEDILSNLTSSQALLTMDWAMKYLPRRFREAQQDWFGKKGTSWHVTVAVMKSGSEFEILCFVHLIQPCVQNWWSVLLVLEASLLELKRRRPNITEVSLRSDNAGCYHCAPLILSMADLAKKVDIIISRYDFSEVQAGKDICDRKIAPMKAHIERYVNEGNDVLTAEDMHTALESYNGVRGCYASVLKIGDMPSSDETLKWPGVTNFTNFSFEEGGVRSWLAYSIGNQFHPYAKLIKQPPGPLITTYTVGHYTEPKVLTGAIRQQRDDVQFSCTESNCVKTFPTDELLTHHLAAGRHMFRPLKESRLDKIARQWAEKIGEMQAGPSCSSKGVETVGLGTASASMSQAILSGWARKISKARKRFSQQVKDFLLAQFMIGANTGKKENPETVSRRLKSHFHRDDCLTTQQIASYFSRLALLHKSGTLPSKSWTDVQNNAVELVERQVLVDAVLNQCEL